MMLWSQGEADLKAGGDIGICRGVVTASVFAHAHMPRQRKSASPVRDSGGSALPSAAMRSVSYWEMMADEGSEGPTATI